MSNRILRRVVAFSLVTVLIASAGAYTFAAMAEKGSISGKVLTTKGEPAANVQLRLEQEVPIGMDKGGRRSSPAVNDSGATELMQGVKIIARANTDKDGKFEFKNLDTGAYILVGGNKNIGWIYYPLAVQPNENTDLGEIKLYKE